MYIDERDKNKKLRITVTGKGGPLPFIASIPLPVEDEFLLRMPYGSTVLSAFNKVGETRPRLYIMLEDYKELQTWRVRVIGTGNRLPREMGNFNFVGTVNDTPFVWHVFAEKYENVYRPDEEPEFDPDTGYGVG